MQQKSKLQPHMILVGQRYNWLFSSSFCRIFDCYIAVLFCFVHNFILLFTLVWFNSFTSCNFLTFSFPVVVCFVFSFLQCVILFLANALTSPLIHFLSFIRLFCYSFYKSATFFLNTDQCCQFDIF